MLRKIILVLNFAACANMTPEEAAAWERSFAAINQSLRDYQQQNKTCYTNKIGDTYQTRCY